MASKLKFVNDDGLVRVIASEDVKEGEPLVLAPKDALMLERGALIVRTQGG